jgi:hypothetical protein
MPDRDELDRLIDCELARYAEPRPGLEQRLLARIDAHSSAPSLVFHAWQRWALATAITIALVLVLSIPHFMHRETSTTTAHGTTAEHAPAARSQAVPPESKLEIRPLPKIANTTHHVARAPRSNRPSENTTRPRLDIFPAPQPLSPQEQALVAIATAPSDSARENLLASQRQLDAPLQISAIEIPPITAPDEGRK